MLTELILENTLGGYEPEEVVALLSCFVFQEKTEVEPVLTGRLESGRDAIVGIADRVGRVQDMHKVVAEEHKGLKFGLIEVVYEWAKGMVGDHRFFLDRNNSSGDFVQPFDKITNLTDVAEGTIVRVITRLDETCREVRDAARVIGDAELFKKMEEAQNKIKRDSEWEFTVKDSSTMMTGMLFQLCSQQVCISKSTRIGGAIDVSRGWVYCSGHGEEALGKKRWRCKDEAG